MPGGIARPPGRRLCAVLASVPIRLSWGCLLPRSGRLQAVGLVVVLLLGGVEGGHGQSATESVPFCREVPRRTATVDTRGLGAVYCTGSPFLERPLQGAHATARPVFYGAVPLAWGGALLSGEDQAYADAYRLTVAQGATYGLVLGLKHAVGRPRPYVTRALTSRSSHYADAQRADAYTSFPSGHAALSATLVTSWSLSQPKWYVVGPGSAWAAAVALSRLHLGVHYPSDVIVGMGIGVGVAFLIHQLRTSLTPPIVERGFRPGLRAPAPIGLRFRF
jgi:membrane-associated phospholipid phosphatase